MLLLSHGDRTKRVGLRFEAYAPEHLMRIERGLSLARTTGDFHVAIAAIRESSPPPLTSAEHKDLDTQLHRLLQLQAYRMLIDPLEFELERADFLERIDNKEAWTFAFSLFALRARIDFPLETFEAIVWLLEPRLRGIYASETREAASASSTPGEDLVSAINSSEPLRLLFGTERFEVDGQNVLGPCEHGYAAKVGTNAVSPRAMPEVQQRFESAIPSDFGPLLVEWRRTYVFSFHHIRKRLALGDDERYVEALRRDADWQLVRVMRDVDRALKKIRSFRTRAHREGWWVLSTDGLDA